MITMQGYKGTRDFLPKDWQLIQYLFNKWRQVSNLFGFEEYEAPIIEPVKLFTDKSGEEIKEQLFWFKDKSGRSVCLRPELTPQLARYVVQYGKGLKKPLKWFSIPRLFRYEQPQKGRGREFFQYNADIIGSTIESTAELISLCINLLRNIGLKSTDFKIKINDRQIVDKLADMFVKKFKIPKVARNNLSRLIDKRFKISEKEFFFTLDGFVNPEDREEIKKVFKLKGKECLKYLNSLGISTKRLEKLFSLVNKRFVEFDLSIVRGLDYYTGIVFEAVDSKRELRSILGGGEYDNLISDFGGERIPCVGFGVGDMVLIELLKNKKLVPSFAKKGLFIITIGDVFKKANDLAKNLRNKGINVFVNTNKLSISKQLALAGSLGYNKVLIIGERDLKQKRVTIKNIVTGKEQKVSLKITMIKKAVQ